MGMVGSHSPLPLPALSGDRTTVPRPRRPLDPAEAPGDHVRRWYENELGWPTVPAGRAGPTAPVRLRVGERFDVLDVPAEAGRAGLRHLAPGSPVAVRGGRMRLLVAAGSAEELPGLLEWLEWGGLPPGRTVIGEGGAMDAPAPPEGALGVPPDRTRASQGAAVWLRPPGPGGEAEASLPTLSAVGGVGGAPDLVRLVNTLATRCHRLRLRHAYVRQPAR